MPSVVVIKSAWNTAFVGALYTLNSVSLIPEFAPGKMAEASDLSMGEKPSPVQQLESIHLESGKNDERPVYGIDEAHQKKVMFGSPLTLISPWQANHILTSYTDP